MDDVWRFSWDQHNSQHLAQHGVTAEEAEHVLRSDLLDLDHHITEEGEERWVAVGQTATGRLLVVVWTIREDGAYRLVTAYPANKGLTVMYLRLMQGGV